MGPELFVLVLGSACLPIPLNQNFCTVFSWVSRSTCSAIFLNAPEGSRRKLQGELCVRRASVVSSHWEYPRWDKGDPSQGTLLNPLLALLNRDLIQRVYVPKDPLILSPRIVGYGILHPKPPKTLNAMNP